MADYDDACKFSRAAASSRAGTVTIHVMSLRMGGTAVLLPGGAAALILTSTRRRTRAHVKDNDNPTCR